MPCHDDRNDPRYYSSGAEFDDNKYQLEQLKPRLEAATQAACAAGRLLHKNDMLKHLPQDVQSWMVQHAVNDLEKGDPWLSIADANPTRK